MLFKSKDLLKKDVKIDYARKTNFLGVIVNVTSPPIG